MIKVNQVLNIGIESDTYLLLSSVIKVVMPAAVPFEDYRILVELVQSSDGNYTVTGWPQSVRWVGNRLPVISTGDSAITVLTFTTFDRGISWIGDSQNVAQPDSILGDINAALAAILQPET